MTDDIIERKLERVITPEEREKKQKELEDQIVRDEEDVKAVMDNFAGRRFVYRLLVRAGIYKEIFVQGEADTTTFNLGGRNQGLQLLDEVTRITPGSYELMIKENKDG